MSRSAAHTLTLVIICLVAVAAAFAIQRFYRSAWSESGQANELGQAGEHERFIARFDSLSRARLHPIVQRSQVFTNATFDEDREEWVLTVNTGRWDRLSKIFRKDLVVQLYTGFQEVRAQAGGDPEHAKLVIDDEEGKELLVCMIPESLRLAPTVNTRSVAKLAIVAISLGLPILALMFFRSKRKEILLAVLSVLFSIFIIELSLKYFCPQIDERDKMFEYDPDLGWRFIPNRRNFIVCAGNRRQYIDINSWGFRDDPVPSDHDDMRKILVLGDSFVSNVSVRDDEVFTEVLEGMLENTAVLNFGVNGYGQVQEYLLLRQWLDRIDPDIVILLIYVRNDFDDNVGVNWRYLPPVARWDSEYSNLRLEPPPSDFASDESDYERLLTLCGRSHLYYLVNSRLDILIDRLTQWRESEYEASLYTPPELYLCRVEPSRSTGLLYKTMETLLLKIARYVEGRKTPMMFVIAPSFLQADADLWASAMMEYDVDPKDCMRSLPNRRLMQFADENGLVMLDLLPILESELRKGRRIFNPEEQHWTSEGNRIVADAVLDYLRSKSLVEPSHN